MTEVRVPQPATLRRYGLSLDEWREIMERQGWKCAICGNVPASRILHLDHQHVRGWAKKPPEERKMYLRGAICFPCNAILRVRVTVAWLRAAAKYLAAYERRLTRAERK